MKFLERWRWIPSWEGCYQVSDRGQVVGHAGNLMKQQKDHNGYPVVHLRDGKRNKLVKVHRCVLAAFIGPDERQVNHKNGKKTDNRLFNLEYATGSENIRHAHALKLRDYRGEKNGHSKLTNDLVREIRQLCKKYTVAKVARIKKLSFTTVSNIKKRKTWLHI